MSDMIFQITKINQNLETDNYLLQIFLCLLARLTFLLVQDIHQLLKNCWDWCLYPEFLGLDGHLEQVL